MQTSTQNSDRVQRRFQSVLKTMHYKTLKAHKTIVY